MPGAIGRTPQVLSPAGGLNVRSSIQLLGVYLAGFFCLALAVLKLTIAVHWSWWRVLLPLWVVLGHNSLYIVVGLVWLYFADNGTTSVEEVTIRQERSYFYPLSGMFCFLVFVDSLLRHAEGPETRFWLSPGGWQMIFVSGALSVACQPLFWSDIVRPGDRRTSRE